jgi:hypothetical protein
MFIPDPDFLSHPVLSIQASGVALVLELKSLLACRAISLGLISMSSHWSIVSIETKEDTISRSSLPYLF